MERGYILSIDQSTQGTKAILLDGQGQFVLRRDLPHRQLISAQGWVGHDAKEIAENIIRVAQAAVRDSGIDSRRLPAWRTPISGRGRGPVGAGYRQAGV